GYYPQVDFMNAVDKFMGEPYNEERWAKMQSIPVETLMNKVITYYPNNSIYTPLYTPFVDEDDNPIIDENHPFEYQFEDDGTITGGTDLKVVGIVKPKSNIRYGSLKTGFYYTDEFVKQFIIDNLTSEISTFIRDYVAAKALEGTKVQGYTSGKATVGGTTITYGIYYDQTFYNKGEEITQTVFLGDSSGTGLIAALLGSPVYTLTPRHVGGGETPSSISIYPKSFKDKYLVTNYLDKWNGDENIVLKEKTIPPSMREEIKYVDNLEVIIALINGIIDIVTIALVAFTALSLVVSTVMIAIITYVSVMERIKEIGVIRSMGGRKRDVSHLFNVETFIIGGLAGLFGIALTYIFEFIMNITVGAIYKLGMIVDLTPLTAGIVILVSIILTSISGLIPAASAARKDPVEALRTE
nr:ABC transporter permease [Bacilli bacterium]